MSDLIVIVYPTVAMAEQARRRLINLQKEQVVALDDAVIVAPTEDGKVRLEQLMNATPMGALTGSFWGLLIGGLFLKPAFGASSGAVCGAFTDIGIRASFIRKLTASLKPGKGALFLFVKVMIADVVLKRIESFGGAVLKTSLDETREQVLRNALRHASEEPQP